MTSQTFTYFEFCLKIVHSYDIRSIIPIFSALGVYAAKSLFRRRATFLASQRGRHLRRRVRGAPVSVFLQRLLVPVVGWKDVGQRHTKTHWIKQMFVALGWFCSVDWLSGRVYFW